ncbi:MAG: formimidoylglutamate deiminase [Cyclobacteriaceae bacterium]|nr:formimidoylglutamate deiminase [Cyclobacteriaceae bacterium]
MRKYKFSGLYKNGQWVQPAYVTLNDQGDVVRINNQPEGVDYELVEGFAVPGFINTHSHAFQYAMTGFAEQSGEGKEDFWAWREMMYGLASTVSPEDLEAIAALCYSEMLCNGYTHVVEFHYLHHDQKGKHYENLAEMGERLLRAAQHVGIGMTLVPVYYNRGGFERKANDQQKRFLSATTDEYFKLLDHSIQIIKKYPLANAGFGVHSLRAAGTSDLLRIIEEGSETLPFHIHVAEQKKEVEECLDFLGARPVEWLLGNAGLSDRFTLVHATHMNNNEVKRLAESHAVVALCPTTEGNLGDGIFPFREYIRCGGRWGIGSDSHIGLDPAEELRLLDYGQRLTSKKRNTFVGNSIYFGENAFNQALTNGRLSAGCSETDILAVGESFNVLVLDANHPLICVQPLDRLLNILVYALKSTMIKGTIVRGDWVVKEQRHIKEREIKAGFNKFAKNYLSKL